MDLREYAKAFVPGLTIVAMIGLSYFGVGPQMTVEQAVSLIIGGLVASIGVFATPNKAATK